MKEKVLITGASGFLGYHIICEALKNDLEVYAAIRKTSNINHLKDLDLKFTYPDYSNTDSLKQEISENKYDYIIHAAGITRARSAEEYDNINAGHTYNLAKAAAESKYRVKKFVLIGSLAAIGPLNTLDGIITEATEPKPVTAYGRSKLLAEEQLKSIKGLRYTILRPTGIYGPRDKDIFIFFKQLRNHLEPYIGRMEQHLSLIYAGDVAQVAIKALNTGQQKAYNLSDGNHYSRYELGEIGKYELNVKAIKIHLPVSFVKIIAMIAEKIGSLNNKATVLNVEKLNELMAVNWHCDITPAKTDLGFTPLHNLRSGLKETLNWYKANKWL